MSTKRNFLKTKLCIQYGQPQPVATRLRLIRISQPTGRTATGYPYFIHSFAFRELRFVLIMLYDSSKVYVDLYSAFLRKAPQIRSDMDHTVLPANYTMPAFTPQLQNITALWLVLILPSHGG